MSSFTCGWKKRGGAGALTTSCFCCEADVWKDEEVGGEGDGKLEGLHACMCATHAYYVVETFPMCPACWLYLEGRHTHYRCDPGCDPRCRADKADFESLQPNLRISELSACRYKSKFASVGAVPTPPCVFIFQPPPSGRVLCNFEEIETNRKGGECGSGIVVGFGLGDVAWCGSHYNSS